jgi:hypothetical protein
VIPADQYQQKVGAAAGSGQLPDIVGSNIVRMPDFINEGLLLDITKPFDALPNAKKRAANSDRGQFCQRKDLRCSSRRGRRCSITKSFSRKLGLDSK